MSNSYTIGNLFSMYYENEFSSVEDIELPDFSAQHKRKMKKAFRFFDRNKAVYCNAYSTSKIQSPLSVRKRILIAVMILYVGKKLQISVKGGDHTNNVTKNELINLAISAEFV